MTETNGLGGLSLTALIFCPRMPDPSFTHLFFMEKAWELVRFENGDSRSGGRGAGLWVVLLIIAQYLSGWVGLPFFFFLRV